MTAALAGIYTAPAAAVVEQRSSYGSVQFSGLGCLLGDMAQVDLDEDAAQINVVTPIVGDVLPDSAGRPVAQVVEAEDDGLGTVEFRARGIDCYVSSLRAWTTALIPVQIDYLVAIPSPAKPRPRSECGGGSSTGLGIQDLTAHHVSCSTARTVTRGWRRRGCVPATDPGGPRSTRCVSHGFVCRARAPATPRPYPCGAHGARR